MEWLNNTIKIVPPKKPKKLTATRFATILGLNPWSTPFEVWCAVTRTYEEPFTDTIYTKAGKIIEPKQAAYMREQFFWKKMLTPTDVYGEDYFKKTWGDFFPDRDVIGGMWDYLFVDKEDKPTTVLEMKTTKRAEDWADDIPEYYALQAALYAYMLGVDDVIMVCSFLDEKDYTDPEKFECSIDNTITRSFKLSARYPTFEKKYVKPALKWWKDHVVSGVSPEFDEKKDADILKALRTNNLSPETDLAALVKEAEDLKAKLDAHAAEVKEDEDRYKVVTDMIKQAAVKQFRDGDKNVSVPGTRFTWVVNRQTTETVDKKKLKEDGLFDKYVSSKPKYVLTAKEIKEE